MTAVERLAEFAVSSPYEELSETARQQLKIRILDDLGCAIGAMDAEPRQMIRKNIAEFDANGECTLLGGGRASPEHAAFHNGAAVRYKRIWPRGIKKTDLRLDAWLKDVAPSADTATLVLARSQKVERVPATLFCRVGQPSGGVRTNSQRRTPWPSHPCLQFARHRT